MPKKDAPRTENEVQRSRIVILTPSDSRIEFGFNAQRLEYHPRRVEDWVEVTHNQALKHFLPRGHALRGLFHDEICKLVEAGKRTKAGRAIMKEVRERGDDK